ncbi:MAG: hypothetical protein WCO56_18585 [Verrucomicrobiota bacterium]
MAFLFYRKRSTGGVVRYEQLQPLKLGGKNGPIARHVATLKGEQSEAGWELPVATLTQLAGLPAAEEVTVLFDISGNGIVCLYELRNIAGLLRSGKVNLALDFDVLVDAPVGKTSADFKKAFELPAVQPKKRLREILVLGTDDWKWEKPALNLGATLVGPG